MVNKGEADGRYILFHVLDVLRGAAVSDWCPRPVIGIAVTRVFDSSAENQRCSGVHPDVRPSDVNKASRHYRLGMSPNLVLPSMGLISR